MTWAREPDTERRLNAAIEVIDDLQAYWPLTLRQIFYQLVTRNVLENEHSVYQRLSRELTRAREEGLVPWETMEDRSRGILDTPIYHGGPAEFVDRLEDSYYRDVLAGQKCRVEVWCEKDALAHVLYRTASQYRVPVVTARGFVSASYRRDFSDRVLDSAAIHKQETVLLYFGDLDPSGWFMLKSMIEKLYTDAYLGRVEDWFGWRRVALTEAQVTAHNLPHNPKAFKETDPNANKYRELFGDLAVELDALPPAVLEDMVKDSIASVLDLDLLQKEMKKEARERRKLKRHFTGFTP